MKKTWDTLARKNAMHFIATEREDWDLESFLGSGRETIQTLFDMVGQPTEGNGVLLEIGCGIGRLAFSFAESFDKVIGIDVSEEMINRANSLKEQLGYTNVEFYCNNGQDISFIPTDSCDFGFSYIVFQHIPDRNVILGYIKELARVVKPGGKVLFQVPIYQTRVLVYPWRFIQALFRSVLWRLEAWGWVLPERGVAFRGSRLSMKQLKDTLDESNLELLTMVPRQTTYRFCDEMIIYCRKT